MIKCLICGKEVGMLAGKHLTNHGITAKEYREKFPGSITKEPKEVSEETRTKMGNSRRGKKHDQATKDKIGSKHKGKTRTPEEIDKWRISYAQFIEENGSPMTGKDRGEAFKQHMSEVAKARPKELVQAKVDAMLAARRGSKATDEQRETYRNARLKYMEENPDKLPSRLFNTKPELEFEDELKKLSISHSRNFRLGNRLYDFKIGDTLIEIDGPYHYDFKMYGDRTMSDDKRKELFKVNQDIDLLKNQIAKDNNYPLYRIKVGGCLPSDWKEQLISQGCTLFI